MSWCQAYLDQIAYEIDQKILHSLNQFMLVYENEGAVAEPPAESTVTDQSSDPTNHDTNGQTPEPPAQKSEPKKPENKKLFTQEDINKFLAEERRKTQKNRDSQIEQLKNLRDSLQLTEQQKEQLTNQIEQLQNENLTVQELAKKDKEKLSKEFEKREKQILDEKHTVWRLYSEEKITRELQDAAIENKAISPQQIINFLKPNTKLVEELKEGRPTGRWQAKTTFSDKDEKGEPITLELTVTEAVKRMSEMSEHWNLFNSGAMSGAVALIWVLLVVLATAVRSRLKTLLNTKSGVKRIWGNNHASCS